jgi:hypothetical protein
MRDRRFAEALAACDELIRRDENRFRSRPEASWLKAEAHYYRGAALYELTGDNREAARELKRATEAGHLNAVRNLTNAMWRQHQGDPEFAWMDADPAAFRRILRIGAELGDRRSALILGDESSPAPVGRRERIYWSLIGVALSLDDSLEVRERRMRNTITRVGEREVDAALSEFSPLGSGTAAGPGQLPGRSLITRAYADAWLRRTYGESYGRRGTQGAQPGPSPTTLEYFRAQQALANVFQHYTAAFLLVPGGRQCEDKTMVPLSRKAIVALLSPSDNVIVRCGPITHVAMVHHVDRAADRVYFADGLFQYWQPTHNSCITNFDLVPFLHGGFLAAVPVHEVEPMIQAVVTLRDRPPTSGTT